MPGVADERAALKAYLDFQRATIQHKLEGLSDDDLRRAVAPAGLTLLGLVKHLALVEHWWFVMNFARTGEGHLFNWTEEDPDIDFRILEDQSTDAIVRAYLGACERSRQVVA